MSNSHKDNWRELAELLGLPADEPAPAASAPPPALPAAAAPVPALPVEPPMEPLPPFEEFVRVVSVEAAAVEETLDVEEATIEDADLDAGESVSEGEPVEDGDKPQEEKRGRRRGRRGRRRGRDNAPEGAEAQKSSAAPSENAVPVADAPLAAKDSGTVEERDDQRGRQRRRPARSENAESPDTATTAVVDDPSDQDDDFSQDAWADWNVPNWQELIDGLYRPDR